MSDLHVFQIIGYGDSAKNLDTGAGIRVYIFLYKTMMSFNG